MVRSSETCNSKPLGLEDEAGVLDLGLVGSLGRSLAGVVIGKGRDGSHNVLNATFRCERRHRRATFDAGKFALVKSFIPCPVTIILK